MCLTTTARRSWWIASKLKINGQPQRGYLTMDFILHGYCGVYCGACPVVLETKDGRIGEDKQCYGCKSEKPTGYCATCGIKVCAQRKGYEFCNQCGELKTCELMQKFVSDKQYPYGQCVLKNMETIRVMGLPKWVEMQDGRWRCKNCGASYSWYEETCRQCGQAVASYKADLHSASEPNC